MIFDLSQTIQSMRHFFGAWVWISEVEVTMKNCYRMDGDFIIYEYALTYWDGERKRYIYGKGEQGQNAQEQADTAKKQLFEALHGVSLERYENEQVFIFMPEKCTKKGF